ncbi:MAG: hypothetical protein EAY68_05775 [Bacteroidetes bacterium]|nr:MAG: hypothetical protein EAY68_05775 [Bacteroidota bacterium]
MKLRSLLLLSFALILQTLVHAQLPNDVDIKSIQVDKLSDSQIADFYNRAKQSGLNDAQLSEALLAKGMSATELAKLEARLKQVNVSAGATAPSKVVTNTTVVRKQNTATNETYEYEFSATELKVFGARVFSNPSMSFEPNLKLGTPSNYLVGPDDELVVQVYGQSEASYKLTVSPDGNITIPNVGPISVQGLPIQAATQKIKTRLQSTIYSALASGATKIQVTLGNIRSIKVVVTGQAKKPGVYTVSSLATAFNLLYLCGGPNFEGSYRDIQVVRNGRVIQKIDLYPFLTGGNSLSNILLAENDVIHIPYQKQRIQLEGEAKQTGFFEATAKESLAKILEYAGGFTDSAFKKHVTVVRNNGFEKEVKVIPATQLSSYIISGGEIVSIEKVDSEIKNRISLSGAVKRPGLYDVASSKTLVSLLQNAQGAQEYAYLDRILIRRTNADLSTTILSANLNAIIKGIQLDLVLVAKDEVFVASSADLQTKATITIEGEVRSPKQITYSKGITVKDAILLANGFTDKATPTKIEIGRKYRTTDTAISTEYRIAYAINVSTTNDLNALDTTFQLQPFDIIFVRSNPNIGNTAAVSLQGEFQYPGRYIITTKGEKLTHIMERAGGISTFGDIRGASLLRRNTLGLDSLLRSTVKKQLAKTKDTIIQIGNKNQEYEIVAVNISAALADSNSTENIVLQDGDIVIIPMKNQVVKVSGEVLQPSQLSFVDNKKMLHYINRAGGFSPQAYKSKAFLVGANGNAKTIKRFLFFKSYPTVEAGDEIIIPQLPDRSSKKLSTGEIVGITTAVTSLATIVLALIRL